MNKKIETGAKVRWRDRPYNDYHEGTVIWSLAGRRLTDDAAANEIKAVIADALDRDGYKTSRLMFGYRYSTASTLAASLNSDYRGLIIRVDRPKGKPLYYAPLAKNVELIKTGAGV
jgi:hypothetical protein